MRQDRHSVHRGISITTRWRELEPMALGHRRFSASFSIDASPQAQEFVATIFDTPAHAAAHALATARRRIDLRLAEEASSL